MDDADEVSKIMRPRDAEASTDVHKVSIKFNFFLSIRYSSFH
jgi:hypothetical protein